MKRYLIYPFIFIGLLFLLTESCKEHRSGNNNVITVNPEEAVVRWPVSTTKLIPLETKPGNLISSVDKVVFDSDRFYILDGKQQKIEAFQSNGDYLFQIAGNGNGPGEYLRLTDFLIHQPDSTIELLDAGSRKILTLDYARNVVNTQKLPVFCQRFLREQGGSHLLFANNQVNRDGSERKADNFFKINAQGDIVRRFFPIHPQSENLMLSEPFSFYARKGESVFSLPLDNHIYAVKKDSVTVDWQISFGHYRVPGELLEPLKKCSDRNRVPEQMKVLNKIAKAGYAYSIHSVLENDAFLFFRFRKGRGVYSVLFDKESRHVQVGVADPQQTDVTLLGQPVLLNDKNQLMTILFPYEINHWLSAMIENSVQQSSRYHQFQEAMKMVKQNDNPVLQVLQLKEFRERIYS